MGHKLVLENSSSAAVNTMPNTIIYLEVVEYLITKLTQIYQTNLELKGAKDCGLNAVLWLQGFRTTMLEIKNAVLVVVFIFFKHNGLYGRLADSNYFYTKESILCTNFCACTTLFVCTLHAWL